MPATVGERRPGESRDALAAHDLFERYRTPIYRFCLSRLRSPEDAEDAVQSTFLRAYSALQRGVEPQHASAWLLKIAHNVCLSRRLAALRRRRVETPRDLGELPDATLASPQAETEELFGLEDALAALPPRMRSVLLLREWQGLSYREIAAEVGASEAAVETLLFRARRELARRLREPWERLAGILFGPFAGLRSVFGASSAPVLATAASVAVVVAAAPSVAHQAPPSPRTSVASAQPIPRPALSAPAQLGAAARLRLRQPPNAPATPPRPSKPRTRVHGGGHSTQLAVVRRGGHSTQLALVRRVRALPAAIATQPATADAAEVAAPAASAPASAPASPAKPVETPTPARPAPLVSAPLVSAPPSQPSAKSVAPVLDDTAAVAAPAVAQATATVADAESAATVSADTAAAAGAASLPTATAPVPPLPAPDQLASTLPR